MTTTLRLISCGVLLFIGCSAPQSPSVSTRGAEPAQAAVGSKSFVTFDIRPDPSAAPSVERYIATHSMNGKTARFRIEIGKQKPADGFTFGTGKLYSDPRSDASEFILELRRALEAQQLPDTSERLTELSFTAAIIGTNLSHAPEGGFFADPPGPWTAIKIFLTDGEGEVFLNLNVKEGKGEFSIKDPEYGDSVLRELAKVL